MESACLKYFSLGSEPEGRIHVEILGGFPSGNVEDFRRVEKVKSRNIVGENVIGDDIQAIVSVVALGDDK